MSRCRGTHLTFGMAKLVRFLLLADNLTYRSHSVAVYMEIYHICVIHDKIIFKTGEKRSVNLVEAIERKNSLSFCLTIHSSSNLLVCPMDLDLCLLVRLFVGIL